MYCRNCGVQVDHAGEFCTNCVPQQPTLQPIPQQASSKRGLGVGATVFVASILLVATYVALHPSNGNSGNTTTSAQASTQDSTPTSDTAPAKDPTYKIGDTFSVGVWTYRVERMRWASSIGSDYMTEYPDAKFLIVYLDAENNDRTASTLPPFKLVDAAQREYDATSKGMFLPGSFGALKSLNPGVASGGAVVFDVPPGNYALQVSGGFEAGGHATVDLLGQQPPQPQQQEQQPQTPPQPQQPGQQQ
jgi:hypothetical protein